MRGRWGLGLSPVTLSLILDEGGCDVTRFNMDYESTSQKTPVEVMRSCSSSIFFLLCCLMVDCIQFNVV